MINLKNLVILPLCSDPHLKGVLFIILQSVVQQHTQGHDAAVKFAVLGSPVGMDNNGGLIWQNIASLPALAFLLLLPLSFLFLKGRFFPTFVCDLSDSLLCKSRILRSFLTSRSSSGLQDSSSSTLGGSGFSGSLDSSTCSSTFSCLVRRAIS